MMEKQLYMMKKPVLWWRNHSYDEETILHFIWWGNHSYDGETILMMKKPFLWWRNHSYDEETILMMKKPFLWWRNHFIWWRNRSTQNHTVKKPVWNWKSNGAETEVQLTNSWFLPHLTNMATPPIVATDYDVNAVTLMNLTFSASRIFIACFLAAWIGKILVTPMLLYFFMTRVFARPIVQLGDFNFKV